ncbi:aldolase/citrate lyase family protein [Dactylosporangium sp. CA-092794]|uniref:aldolase/citrate lyase family protein n=1 Tax=Dactylosporangium sp. CA-092794 TaxID=3239929 RepID=UPI003D8DF4AB
MPSRAAPALGVWSLIASVDVFYALCLRAPDFVVLDWEHGSWSAPDTDVAVQLAGRMGIATVVRCSGPGQHEVQRAIDTGAQAIQVAGLHDASALDELVISYCEPPRGRRGYSPWTYRALGVGGPFPASPLLIAQAESEAVARLLLDDDGDRWPEIGGVFVGRYDLSVSIGEPGRIAAAGVLDVVAKLAQHSSVSGRLLGTVAVDHEDAERVMALGSVFTSVGSDRDLLVRGSV